MKKKSLFFFLLSFALSFWACQPNAASGEVSQTQNGVTVTITKVDFSEQETVVTFVVQPGPEWELDINADVPPQALYNNPILMDEEGVQYTFIQGTYGLPQVDEKTDGIKFENTVTFPPVEGNHITFQTEITISEISFPHPVHVSLADHQVLDTWPIGKGITFSSFKDVPGTVKLLAQNDETMQLEFAFERVLSDGLRLGCLSFYPNDQNLANTGDTAGQFRECLLNEEQMISKTGMDVPADKTLPVSFRITGSVEFIEPFTVSWQK